MVDLAGRRVLVVSNEQVGARMAGPAIRALNLARQLEARGAGVTLATPEDPSDAPDGALDGLELASFGTPAATRFAELAGAADVVVTQPQRVDVAWGLRRSTARVVYDMYVPSFVERIAQLSTEPGDRDFRARLLERDRREYGAAIELGDAFICATERQRDHWLGALGQAGRLDLDLLARDPRGDELVGVVPFGATDAAPPSLEASGGGAIRGELVPEDSIVLLWTGGLWNWFDPVTVVEALHGARRSEPRLRLVVMGVRHPDAQWQEQEASRAARERAEELGMLADGSVVLREGWVPYAERHRFLLDADLAVSAHHEGLETRLSFRTRFLDHLWCGLPTLTTPGGELADRMLRAGAARAVDEPGVAAWEWAIAELAHDVDARQRMARAASELADSYRWTDMAEPLARIVEAQAGRPGEAAPSRRARPLELATYMALLTRVRVEAKGAGSLVEAARGAITGRR